RAARRALQLPAGDEPLAASKVVGWINESIPRWATGLIHADAGGLDRAGPFFDLALDEALQILWRRALGHDQVDAELVHALLDGGAFHRLHDGSIQLFDDRSRGAFGQEERVPGDCFEIWKALLIGSRKRRQERRTATRQQCDRFDGSA